MLRSLRLCRSLHTVPKLPYQGVPGLYSAEGFKTAWSDYQELMLTKLNQAVVDTDNEARVPFHILLNTADKSEQAHVFNYASQAHNNHLFFSSLKGSDAAPSAGVIPGDLNRRIQHKFGSVEGLEQSFKAAAQTVRGNGWVFLVEKPDKSLAILTAHNAGTPYHFGRQQRLDLNGPIAEEDFNELERIQKAVDSNEKNYNIALLALNLWQHAYVPDYGVDGQSKYIEVWWNSIDWSVVGSRLYTLGRT